MEGIVLNISRGSFHDGPGIRTTVFLKGCGLSCVWCHNPESRSMAPQLFFKKSACIMCRKCEDICEKKVHSFLNGHQIAFDRCILCGKCIENCPTKALTSAGSVMTVEEVMREVVKDRAFYEVSGGGLTLSGGDPMESQIEFTADLLREAKCCGIGTAIETSGFAAEAGFERVFPDTDYFLFDYKGSPEIYEKYTGAKFSVIENNLRFLNDKGANIILRCPIIPDVNDTEGHLENIADVIKRFPAIKSAELLFYNTFGISKSISIGETPVFKKEMMDRERKNFFTEKLRKMADIPVK